MCDEDQVIVGGHERQARGTYRRRWAGARGVDFGENGDKVDVGAPMIVSKWQPGARGPPIHANEGTAEQAIPRPLSDLSALGRVMASPANRAAPRAGIDLAKSRNQDRRAPRQRRISAAEGADPRGIETRDVSRKRP